MRLRFVVVLVALVSLCPGAALATAPGDNGRIAYDNSGSLWAVDPAVPGSQGELTNPPTTGSNPAWSPNGTKIAFSVVEGHSVTCGAALTRIYTMNADGSGRTLLTPPVLAEPEMFTDPAWSPDGQKVAFTRFREATCYYDEFEEIWVAEYTVDVFVIDADGGNRVNLTPEEPGDCHQNPSWSPLGDRIVYDDCAGHLWTMNADGTGKALLTAPPFGTDMDADWSPDGTKIAFTRWSLGVFVVDTDGTDVTQVAFPCAQTSCRVYQPTWAPDGSRIAFVHLEGGTSLHTVRTDGTGEAIVVGPSVAHPSWQPIPRGYVRPKGATPLRVPLVPAFKACTAPNRGHGSPLAFPSCSPPVPASGGVFVGVGDGNPAPAKSIGQVKLRTLTVTGSGDSADVSIDVGITNVMNTSDRSDYTGELLLELPLRITDRFNKPSPSGTGPGTGDTSFFATVPCSPTADTTLGSACALASTADSILPGTVRAGARSIWGLEQVRLHDGGLDGDAETASDNQLLAVQGLFAP